MADQSTDHKMGSDTEMADSAVLDKGKGKGKAPKADAMEESDDSESEASGVEDEVRVHRSFSTCGFA